MCKIDGEYNRVQFLRRVHNEDICAICDSRCEIVPCPAVKIVEHDEGNVVVYYKGFHTCVAKQKSTAQKAKELMAKNVGVRPSMIVNEEMKKVLRADEIDWEHFTEIATENCNRRSLYNARAEIKSTIDANGNSFDAVCLFKRNTDKQDKYLIYRVNNDAMSNGLPTFIFKSSKSSADLAISMDREMGEHRKAYAHVDVKHDRVHGLQTVTLWMYNDKIAKLLCIATMEISAENGDNLTLFWTTLNDMLRDVSGDSSYLFNPIGLISLWGC
jgi:hypothetical protein